MNNVKGAEPRADEIRQVAIDHHHDAVGYFTTEYERMAKDRFADAFTYGRHKIDVILDRELRRLPSGSRVLDVGCGTGAYLRRFEALGLVPAGVEPAPAMIAVARRENPQVTLEQAVATRLPFPDQSFDFVTSIEVFRYLSLEDTRAALAECRRVLRPGGTVFATMVNRWALDGFFVLQRARQMFLGKTYDRKHPHCEFVTPREVRKELERAGFVDIRTLGRLAGPVRAAYKLPSNFGARLARRIEAIDDFVHEFPVTTPFAGHLIAIAKRPADG